MNLFGIIIKRNIIFMGVNMKLSRKLTLNFIALIILSIIIISLISNSMINSRFENYLIKEREGKFNRIYEEINDLYNSNNLKLDHMELMHYALSENINIAIKDRDGKTLYNTDTRKGMGMGNMHNRRGHMMRPSQGQYVEKVYPLTYKNDHIGDLIIGYIDNDYLTESAMIFKSTLFKSFALSSLITIFVGLVFSIILSSRLTNPLVDIKNTANEIQSGNLSAQAMAKTDIIEIQELSQSLNYLARTLDQQESIRRRYASDISHELRTPLTTLKTHLEAIMDGVWEANADHLEILMDETQRLTNLVENLKDSFIKEDYNVELKKSDFDLSQEVLNIITTFRPICNQYDFNIESSIEENIAVYMDRDKFRQVMNNLLSNSLRYLDQGGSVNISLAKTDSNIRLEIEDNGHGIRGDNLPFIFDRFYRVDGSRDKTTGGSGLGLSIVKSIIEAHGGNINVSSIYGEGTKFIIILPLNFHS